jgi:phthiocerol/phenolphthiocerol synthesis type-I polyketide synthase D
MLFGLIFFASNENFSSEGKYNLVIESAKFADQNGFLSVWLPERHFTQLGCLYPNPAVLHAALAKETKQIRLRAGSVVLPLHHPIRITEDWAVVDNLSGGRVDISFASGWNPKDFAFCPEKYTDRYEQMYLGIQTVQKLWKGEFVSVKSGDGKEVQIRTYPTPIQRELPIWLTAASNPQTFIKAGELGVNLLTHMLDQGIEELTDKVNLYRQARATHGHKPEDGQVTVMLHTLIGKDVNVVREQVRAPFCEYLKSNTNLLKELAYSRGRNIDITALPPAELNDFVNFLFERFFTTRALMGTPETCLNLVNQLRLIGVNEIACLLDFGIENELILENLPYLNELKELCQASISVDSFIEESQEEQKNDSQDSSSYADGQFYKQHNRTTELLSSPLHQIQDRCGVKIDGLEFYNRFAELGVNYGSSFKCIEYLYRSDREVIGHIQLPEELISETNFYNNIHPVLLDNCFLLLGALTPNNMVAHKNLLSFPNGMQKLQFYGKAGNRVWSHAVFSSKPSNKDMFEGDVRILNVSGDLVAEIRNLRFQLTELALPDATTLPQQVSNQRVKTSEISTVLLAVQPKERYQLLEGYLHAEVARVLLMNVSQIDVNQPLMNLGLDSLMAIEIRNKIEVDLGVVVPMVSLLQNPSISQLVPSILSNLTTVADEFVQTKNSGEDYINEEEFVL